MLCQYPQKFLPGKQFGPIKSHLFICWAFRTANPYKFTLGVQVPNHMNYIADYRTKDSKSDQIVCRVKFFSDMARGQQLYVCFEKILAFIFTFILYSSYVMIYDAISIVIFVHFCRYFFVSVVFSANKMHNVFEMHCVQMCRSSSRNGEQA